MVEMQKFNTGTNCIMEVTVVYYHSTSSILSVQSRTSFCFAILCNYQGCNMAVVQPWSAEVCPGNASLIIRHHPVTKAT